MTRMNGFVKLGLVIGGYVFACLIASAVVYFWQLSTQNAAAQASAGMYAGGDLLLFISVCGVLGLFPTALGLYFLLRSVKR
jgi:hypothetical protein